MLLVVRYRKTIKPNHKLKYQIGSNTYSHKISFSRITFSRMYTLSYFSGISIGDQINSDERGHECVWSLILVEVCKPRISTYVPPHCRSTERRNLHFLLLLSFRNNSYKEKFKSNQKTYLYPDYIFKKKSSIEQQLVLSVVI